MAEMTVEKCIDFCSVSGSRSHTKHVYAGLENVDECCCRNRLFDPDRSPQPTVYSKCIAKCVGNESEMCGGPDQGPCNFTGACNNNRCHNHEFEQFLVK